MPAARQQHLNELLDKGRNFGLSAAEQQELEDMLDEVDRKSFWMLARRVLSPQKKATPGRTAPHRRSAEGG